MPNVVDQDGNPVMTGGPLPPININDEGIITAAVELLHRPPPHPYHQQQQQQFRRPSTQSTDDVKREYLSRNPAVAINMTGQLPAANKNPQSMSEAISDLYQPTFYSAQPPPSANKGNKSIRKLSRNGSVGSDGPPILTSFRPSKGGSVGSEGPPPSSYHDKVAKKTNNNLMGQAPQPPSRRPSDSVSNRTKTQHTAATRTTAATNTTGEQTSRSGNIVTNDSIHSRSCSAASWNHNNHPSALAAAAAIASGAMNDNGSITGDSSIISGSGASYRKATATTTTAIPNGKENHQFYNNHHHHHHRRRHSFNHVNHSKHHADNSYYDDGYSVDNESESHYSYQSTSRRSSTNGATAGGSIIGTSSSIVGSCFRPVAVKAVPVVPPSSAPTTARKTHHVRQNSWTASSVISNSNRSIRSIPREIIGYATPVVIPEKPKTTNKIIVSSSKSISSLPSSDLVVGTATMETAGGKRKGITKSKDTKKGDSTSCDIESQLKKDSSSNKNKKLIDISKMKKMAKGSNKFLSTVLDSVTSRRSTKSASDGKNDHEGGNQSDDGEDCYINNSSSSSGSSSGESEDEERNKGESEEDSDDEDEICCPCSFCPKKHSNVCIVARSSVWVGILTVLIVIMILLYRILAYMEQQRER